MEWLFGLAILPLLLCGLMCVGGMALAAIGLRRGATKRACCDDDMTPSTTGQEHAGASRP